MAKPVYSLYEFHLRSKLFVNFFLVIVFLSISSVFIGIGSAIYGIQLLFGKPEGSFYIYIFAALFSSVVGTVLYWFAGHWFMARKLSRIFNRIPPDPKDGYHKRLVGVKDEIEQACGMSGIGLGIIPAREINAFAIDDGKNREIFCTEGLVSTSSRYELQAVIAFLMLSLESGYCRIISYLSSLIGMTGRTVSQSCSVVWGGYSEMIPYRILRLPMALMNFVLRISFGRFVHHYTNMMDAAVIKIVMEPGALVSILARIAIDEQRYAGLQSAHAILGFAAVPHFEHMHMPTAGRLRLLRDLIPDRFEEFVEKAAETRRSADVCRYSWAMIDESGELFIGERMFSCPRCLIPLQQDRIQDVPLLTCRQCHGHWMRTLYLERLTLRDFSRFSAAFHKLHEERSADETKRKNDDFSENIKCPSCLKDLSERPIRHVKLTHYFNCSECDASWTDTNELEYFLYRICDARKISRSESLAALKPLLS